MSPAWSLLRAVVEGAVGLQHAGFAPCTRAFHPVRHSSSCCSLYIALSPIGKCSISEGSRSYTVVKRPLPQLPQSEQLAFSFAGRRTSAESGKKDAVSLRPAPRHPRHRGHPTQWRWFLRNQASFPPLDISRDVFSILLDRMVSEHCVDNSNDLVAFFYFVFLIKKLGRMLSLPKDIGKGSTIREEMKVL